MSGFRSLYTFYSAGGTHTHGFCAVTLTQYLRQIPPVQSCFLLISCHRLSAPPCTQGKWRLLIKGKLWLAPLRSAPLCFILYLDRFVPLNTLLPLPTSLRVVLLVSWLWPVDMCLLRPPLRRQAGCGVEGERFDQALLMGPGDPLWTELRCVEH